MAETLRQILVVIDPTRQEQWALDKAIMIAQGQAGLEVTAYLAAFSADPTGPKAPDALF